MISDLERKTIKDFGDEWNHFDQKNNNQELKKIFNNYFEIFPFEKLSKNFIGFDAGCGSGRWAQFLLPKIKQLYCIEPSIKAINIAKKNLVNYKNCTFFNQTINEFFDNTDIKFDFGYCLGVLHHIPDTSNALKVMTSKLKKKAPFLLYIYYNFENRSSLFIILWKISNVLRIFISKLPFRIKKIVTDLIAFFVYLPLAKINYLIDYLNIGFIKLPLSFYKNKSFYVMRNDSLDRFGTSLEKRFSKKQIKKLMIEASLKEIVFYNKEPYWIALGYKK